MLKLDYSGFYFLRTMFPNYWTMLYMNSDPRRDQRFSASFCANRIDVYVQLSDSFRSYHRDIGALRDNYWLELQHA